MKKLLIGVSAIALMLTSAVPAFAKQPKTQTTNVAIVTSSTNVSANTGDNITGTTGGVTQTAGGGSDRKDGKGGSNTAGVTGSTSSTTGNAKAIGVGIVVANTNVADCKCKTSGGSNFAVINSTTTADANTGWNSTGTTGGVTQTAGKGTNNAGVVGTTGSNTGNATAGSGNLVVVNTNVSLN